STAAGIPPSTRPPSSSTAAVSGKSASTAPILPALGSGVCSGRPDFVTQKSRTRLHGLVTLEPGVVEGRPAHHGPPQPRHPLDEGAIRRYERTVLVHRPASRYTPGT